MLTQHLRELEHHGLITRTVHPVVPSHVDNALTAQGLTTLPITRIAARVECVVSDEASAPRALVPPRSFISNTLAAGG
jgi:DNA-binding HxlR family transcriptional regulator